MFFRRVCVPAVPLSFTTPAKAGEEPLARVHGRGQQAHGSKPYQGDTDNQLPDLQSKWQEEMWPI